MVLCRKAGKDAHNSAFALCELSRRHPGQPSVQGPGSQDRVAPASMEKSIFLFCETMAYCIIE